jgi:hypothetical protein
MYPPIEMGGIMAPPRPSFFVNQVYAFVRDALSEDLEVLAEIEASFHLLHLSWGKGPYDRRSSHARLLAFLAYHSSGRSRPSPSHLYWAYTGSVKALVPQGNEEAEFVGLEELLVQAKEAMPWAWVGPFSEGVVVWREGELVALLQIERRGEGEYLGLAAVEGKRGLPDPALRLRVSEGLSGRTLVLEGEGAEISELAKRLAQGVAQVLEGRKFWA